MFKLKSKKGGRGNSKYTQEASGVLFLSLHVGYANVSICEESLKLSLVTLLMGFDTVHRNFQEGKQGLVLVPISK